MEISTLTIKIIIILIPGLISYLIYKRITVRNSKKTDFQSVINSILLGFIAYVALQIINLCLCYIGNFCGGSYVYTLEIFKSISKDSIPYDEVIYATFLGIVIAYILAYLDSNNIINRLAIKIGASSKWNDDNLYTIYLNNKETDWIYVRDIKNNLTYVGLVSIFAEREEQKEIVLNEVTVYSYPESIFLYNVPSIYLNFHNENIIIEQANINTNGRK